MSGDKKNIRRSYNSESSSTQRVKRLLFISGFRGKAGGAISMITLAEKLRDMGVESRLVTADHGPIECLAASSGIRCDRLKAYRWITPIAHRKDFKIRLKFVIKSVLNYLFLEPSYRRYIKGYRPDVVIFNSFDQYVGIRSCHRLGIPTVMHLREYGEEDHGTTFWSDRQVRHYFSQLRGAIAISQDIARKYSIYPIRDLTVIYNGIDEEKYAHPIPKSIEGPINICVVGRLCEGKNQMAALRAVNMLLSQHVSNFHLLLIGGAGSESGKDYERSLQEYVEENVLSEYVDFIGDENNVVPYYQKAHINLICSHREAFGRTAVEGMMNECLCVVPDSGGVAEIILDGANGLVYKNDDDESLADTLEKAITGYESFEGIRRRGYHEAMERFTASANAQNVYQYISTFKSPPIQGGV